MACVYQWLSISTIATGNKNTIRGNRTKRARALTLYLIVSWNEIMSATASVRPARLPRASLPGVPALRLIAIIKYMLFEHSSRIDNGTQLAVFFAAHRHFLHVLKSK